MSQSRKSSRGSVSTQSPDSPVGRSLLLNHDRSKGTNPGPIHFLHPIRHWGYGWVGYREGFKQHPGLLTILPVYQCLHRERLEKVLQKASFFKRCRELSHLCYVSLVSIFVSLPFSFSLPFLLAFSFSPGQTFQPWD